MSASTFIQRQITEICTGGRPVVARKLKQALRILPLYALAAMLVIVIRLIQPWYQIRLGALYSSRIGHFAGNTEIYLCERDAGINVPRQRYVDLFYMGESICNRQLATMWKRVLQIGPTWLFASIVRVNRLIPGSESFEIGSNTQHDRDVHNLLDRIPPHLTFTQEEEAMGESGLRSLGIPAGSPFVCLFVRDSAYLNAYIAQDSPDWGYHDYRDCDIDNYVLAAEELGDLGYFVIRMGKNVRHPIKSTHPLVIDYANSGMRSDFLDIYLGAKCRLCISTGAGWDAIPALLFRRPIVFTNAVPLGYLMAYSNRYLFITKRHIDTLSRRELTMSEIFSMGVGFPMSTNGYTDKGVELIENTETEIRDVVIEMVKRLDSTWSPLGDDEMLQRRFWEIFPKSAVSVYNRRPLQGEVRARFGTSFLRNNQDWLQ